MPFTYLVLDDRKTNGDGGSSQPESIVCRLDDIFNLKLSNHFTLYLELKIRKHENTVVMY